MKIYLRIRKGKLSEENLKKGKVRQNSLYLMYNDSKNKKRWYEFLKLFVYDKAKTEQQRLHNKETMKLAETIYAQKVLDIQSTQHGFISSVKGKINFLDYFKKLVDKRINSEGSYGNWLSCYHHLCKFCNNKDIQLDKVDDLFLERFKEYLLNEKISIKCKGKKVSQNSALSYFNKVKTALKEAYHNKYIKENPCLRVKSIKEKETHREFLTLEEIKLLVKTDCKCKITKQAFLFSCLTGLRFSDVQQLKWDMFKYDELNGWSISYTQKKTKSKQVLPISNEVIKLIGEPKKNNELVFYGLEYSAYKNKQIREWVSSAGIDKHISFHCSRHSFAVLNITLDNDIYTVGKLLGHANISTTQIYTKVIDRKKVEAVSRIPSIGL